MAMPRWLVYTAVITTALALVPLALIARARTVTSAQPRIHLIHDMDHQPKFKAQAENPLFADGRAMRPPVPGAVPAGSFPRDEAVVTGRRQGGWVTALPVPVTAELLRRGEERYNIYCSPCHGLAGYGDGPIAVRAEALQEGTWTPPSSLHTELVRSRPDGHLYNTIANGIRNMPAYGPQIDVADRWAIVAYVRALQFSQGATMDDVPVELRGQLAR
jgi:mono/diheme cytochrome c family protein